MRITEVMDGIGEGVMDAGNRPIEDEPVDQRCDRGEGRAADGTEQTLGDDVQAYASPSLTGSLSVSNSTFQGWNYVAFYQTGSLTLSGNNYAGVTDPSIVTNGYVDSPATWRDSWGLPVKLTQYLAVGSTLTIESGVEVWLGNNSLVVGHYVDNLLYCSRPGHLVANGATFHAAVSGAIVVTDVAGQRSGCCCEPYDPSTAQFDGCTFVGPGTSGSWPLTVQAYASPSLTGSLSVSNSLFQGWNYVAFYQTGAVTLSGNNYAGVSDPSIVTSGTVNYAATWQAGWGLPVKLINYVQLGATLTIEPGVVVHLNDNPLYVGYPQSYPNCSRPGHLIASGVTFNSSGNNGSIRVTEWAGQGNQWCSPYDPSTAQFDGCTFVGSQTAIEISQAALASVLTSHFCSFSDQTIWGIYNPSAYTADASCCFWGHPSGPSGAGSGQGVAVSSNVLFNPWLPTPQGGVGQSQLWARVSNTNNGIGSTGIYEVWTNSFGGLDSESEVQARPLRQSSDAGPLRGIFVKRPDGSTLGGIEAAKHFVLLGQNARKTSAMNLNDRKGLIYANDITPWTFNPAGYFWVGDPHTLQVPAYLDNGILGPGWLVMFIFRGYVNPLFPLFQVTGTADSAHRRSVYAETFLRAALQPDIADDLSDEPSNLELLDTILTSAESVSDLAGILDVIRNGNPNAQFPLLKIKSLTDHIDQQFAGLGDYYDGLGTVVQTFTLVTDITGEAARQLLLEQLANAKADARLKALEWWASQLGGPDQALTGGVADARARFDAMRSAYADQLQALLQASVSPDNLIALGSLALHVAEWAGSVHILVNGVSVQLGPVLAPWLLAYSINGTIEDQAYAAQRCCVAATIQQKLWETGGPLPNLLGGLPAQNPILDEDAENARQLLEINSYLAWLFYDHDLKIANNTWNAWLAPVRDYLNQQPGGFAAAIAALEGQKDMAKAEWERITAPKFLTSHEEPFNPASVNNEYEWLTSLVTTEEPASGSGCGLEPRFDWTPTTPTPGEPIQFQDQSIAAVAWLWDFGDGSESVSGQIPPPRVYSLPGTYTVSLTVTDNQGAQMAASRQIQVNAPPPAASFTLNPASVNVGEPVQFTNTTIGTATAYSWSFGDASPPSAEQHPVHTYMQAGQFTVSLMAYGPGGQSAATVASAVTVNGGIGTINVTSNVPAAAFQLTGPGGGVIAGAGTSTSFASLPTGNYGILWTPLIGYAHPSAESLSLVPGGSITFDGQYTQLPAPDTTPPSVVAVNPSDNAFVGSVTAVELTFSEAILLPGDAVAVTADGIGQNPTSTTLEPIGNGMVRLTLNFAIGLLPGCYRVLAGPTIHDAQGNALDGDENGVGGDAFTSSFITGLQRGDINCDGHLDGLDIQPFVNVLLGTDPDPLHILLSDMDENGTVDLGDASLLVMSLING